MEKSQPEDFLILIADDARTDRRIISCILKRYGFQIEEAVNGIEAVQKAKELKPDLILMDFTMPGLDGPAAIKQIRSDPELQNTKIFMVTGKRNVESLRNALNEGVQEYILKPIEVFKIISRIKSHLNLNISAR